MRVWIVTEETNGTSGDGPDNCVVAVCLTEDIAKAREALLIAQARSRGQVVYGHGDEDSDDWDVSFGVEVHTLLENQDRPPEVVPVVFRCERTKPHDVTAVFPTMPADRNGLMVCYAHVGQHGACDKGWYAKTRRAFPHEYEGLRTELESLGYVLQVCKRITEHHDTLREAARRV